MTDYYFLAFWLIITAGALVTFVTILLTEYPVAKRKVQPLDVVKPKEQAKNHDMKSAVVFALINVMILGLIFTAITWSGIQYKKQQAVLIEATQQILLSTLAEIQDLQQQYFAVNQQYAPNLRTLLLRPPADLTLYYQIKTGHIQGDNQRFYIIAYPVNKSFIEHDCQTYVWLDKGGQYNITGDYTLLSQPDFFTTLTDTYIPACWQNTTLE